jgi:hypothetical protein
MQLSELVQAHPDLAHRVELLITDARSLGAIEGPQRLASVGKRLSRLTPEEVYRWIDPGAFRQEVEEAQARKAEIWYTLRNLLGLSSLVLTLLSVSIAAYAYQQDIIKNPSDIPQPFLILWQNGFHGVDPLTFALTGIVDFLLLVACLFCIIRAQSLKRRAQKVSTRFAKELQRVTDELVSNSDTLAISSNQPAIANVVNAVQQVVNQAMQESRQLMTNAQMAVDQVVQATQQSIQDSNGRVENLFNQRITPMMTRFDRDMQELHGELANYQTRLNDLTTASQDLARASNFLISQAGTYQQISDNINQNITRLNSTQSSMLGQIQTIANGITTAAGNMQATASNMGNATRAVERVATQLDTGLKSTTDQMKRDVSATATTMKDGMDRTVATMTDQVARATDMLSQINTALEVTIRELGNAAQTLAAVSASGASSIPKRSPSQRPLSPSETPQPKTISLEQLRFSAFHPRAVAVETWNTLLLYAYIDSALQAIRADAAKYKDEMGPLPGEVAASSARPLVRGTKITIVPTCQGVTFNPERISFTWVEDWHQAKFRFRADRKLAGSAGNGEITIYAGPLIIATLKIPLLFVEEVSLSSGKDNEVVESAGSPYKQIFASYSHKDKSLVFACRAVLEGIGSKVLIDRDSIKAGEPWRAALMRLIDSADIFQLFWSARSAESQYVRQEWQHALQHHKGEDFIRPVYWEEPLVPPPDELSVLHFAYMDPSLFKIDNRKRFFSIWSIFDIFRRNR